MGGGARDPGRLPVPDAVHPARLPPGPRRLRARRHQPGRRAGRPARDRRRARGGRPRRDRRVHRNAAVVRRDDVSTARCRCAAGSARRSPGVARADPAVDPRVARVGADRRRWIIAVLQNIDIIAAKHRFSSDLASSYSATAVAAKVLIWVAMGAGFYLVPEVSRRHSAGEDGRPVLAKALAIVAVSAVPCLLIYGFASTPLIRAAFGIEPPARGRLAVRPRRRVHGPRGHLPRGPVHARAQAHLVPAPARPRRGRRADPAAPGVEASRRGSRRSCSGSRSRARWSRSGWRCDPTRLGPTGPTRPRRASKSPSSSAPPACRSDGCDEDHRARRQLDHQLRRRDQGRAQRGAGNDPQHQGSRRASRSACAVTTSTSGARSSASRS